MLDESKKFDLPVGMGDDIDEDLMIFSSLKKAAESAVLEDGDEGQLTVDVAETETELIIVSTMAGTPKDKVELHLNNDLLTIKGERTPPISSEAAYHYHECYWGKFSRSIVLPVDVRADLAIAEYKNGLLIVRLPKIKTDQSIPVYIIEE
ncbi:MAG: hypothetical protein COU29_00610 [Candidatus Magasanikbacteria bacterium CG10_big_fil_rev_8_21_14_0_10_36_32]|uniref:SHSP domain-containing protein n=1 Tax=Candidatus Magasanikbacteria bacterium CG10_big_fil_rev_8_21_14_0_10_36_32 TaxID=1974646 RepID=A0A2M6W7E5_9BACT|nr:MAG: hypothetical protein COU29_00610 [Candidatus Magasanikbacteria bacterium CG10_big_fil_rev_8_21_14_0_10_36_32]